MKQPLLYFVLLLLVCQGMKGEIVIPSEEAIIDNHDLSFLSYDYELHNLSAARIEFVTTGECKLDFARWQGNPQVVVVDALILDMTGTDSPPCVTWDLPVRNALFADDTPFNNVKLFVIVRPFSGDHEHVLTLDGHPLEPESVFSKESSDTIFTVVDYEDRNLLPSNTELFVLSASANPSSMTVACHSITFAGVRWFLFGIFTVIVAISTVSLAMYWYQNGRFLLNLRVGITLGIILYSTFRSILYAWDPFVCNGLLHYWAHSLLWWVAYCAIYMAVAFMLLAWFNMTKYNFSKSSQRILMMAGKIQAGAATVLFPVACIVDATVNAFYGVPKDVRGTLDLIGIILFATFVVVLFVQVIMYIVIGAKLLRSLYPGLKSRLSSDQSSIVLLRLTMLMMTIVVGLFVLVCSFVTFSAMGVWTTESFVGNFLSQDIIVLFICILLLAALMTQRLGVDSNSPKITAESPRTTGQLSRSASEFAPKQTQQDDETASIELIGSI